MKALIKDKLSPYLYLKSYSRALFTLWGLVIKESRVSFNQFFTWRYPLRSLFRTIAILLSSINRLLLGRSLKYSFSFTGEDRILESLFKGKITENGFYVDVGCNHPVFLSNTYLFYRRGWRGICIDANQRLINKFKYFRPRDKAVCALVSTTNQQRNFYHLTNNVLSTTEESILEAYRQQGQAVEVVTMASKPLTQILDELHAPQHIDILSIDTEEHDFQVLQSLDLDRYRPKLIIIEVEDFKPDHPGENIVYAYLETKGYTLQGFILTNLYFLRKG